MLQTLVERVEHVDAERVLDRDDRLRRERAERPVHVGPELDALFPDPPQVGEAPHLEAARVGQDGPVPGHEAMEATELAYQLGARAQEEMVGIGEHDLGAGRGEIGRGQALDRALRRHRHEGRRLDRAVRGAHPAEASGAVGPDELEAEGLYAHWISIASPYE